jgi:hypothetical protein
MKNTALVQVALFNQGSSDKNGKMPVILVPFAGSIPNRNVLSGTVAENSGFEVGKTYLVSFRKLEDDVTYGPRYQYTNFGVVESALDKVKVGSELGEAKIFNVNGNSDAETNALQSINANTAKVAEAEVETF